MATISFYAGMSTPAKGTSGTSISRASPAPLQAGDALIAFVTHTSAITAVPSGYTLVNSVTFYGGARTWYHSAYIKTTVTSSDGAVNQVFTQASSGYWGISIGAVRPASGASVVVLESATASSNNATTFTAPVAALTATRTSELFVFGSGMMNEYWASVSFSGATVWDSSDYYYSHGAYQTRTSGQSNTTTWTWNGYSTTDNGAGSITIRLGADPEPATITDTTSLSEAGTGTKATFYPVLSETTSLVESEVRLGRPLVDAIEDALNLLDANGTAKGATAFDSLSWTDLAEISFPTSVSVEDVLTVRGVLADLRRRIGTLSDAASLSEATSVLPRLGSVVTESVRVAPVWAASNKMSATLSDSARLAALVIAGSLVRVADTLSVGDVLSSIRGVYVTEQLRLGALWSAAAKYKLTSQESFRVFDALRKFFAGEALDTIGMASILTSKKQLTPALTDAAGVQDALSKKFVVRVIASDTVAIDDADVLKLVFRPQLRDGVEIAAAYVAPNGNFTTWAINTRSGAVSEYGSYEFNSFAQMGGKYLGASTSGLYELNGDDDNGEDIVATIRSGLMQMTGSRFTMLRDAYLGMRADGSFVLRVITGEGQTYNYTFSADSMTSSKVPLGKGIRARYLAFELVSTGQDFDLDSVEFVPLVSTRRVT